MLDTNPLSYVYAPGMICSRKRMNGRAVLFLLLIIILNALLRSVFHRAQTSLLPRGARFTLKLVLIFARGMVAGALRRERFVSGGCFAFAARSVKSQRRQLFRFEMSTPWEDVCAVLWHGSCVSPRDPVALLSSLLARVGAAPGCGFLATVYYNSGAVMWSPAAAARAFTSCG